MQAIVCGVVSTLNVPHSDKWAGGNACAVKQYFARVMSVFNTLIAEPRIVLVSARFIPHE